jgi:Protein of unknown function DUF262/Protein of unknown function (DUF1524)
MRKIAGDAKNVRALLSGAKYAIDYFQREYRWQAKQITELLNDLANKFLENYEVGDERSAVERYGHYFLGSIIISDKDGQKFLIDGQQRLTSLTLLLIFLHHKLEDEEQRRQLADLIFSQRFGRRSFNLNVPEREPAMDALYMRMPFDDRDQSESVNNIIGRYNDIEEQFSDEIAGAALPYFTDWLIENVHLVEITAYSDDDAYTIFETMNDRGLSLTPTEMLKGYLLTNIEEPKVRARATDIWRQRVSDLNGLGKEEDADAIKAWLRSQYAENIRERKAGASPQDFDLIGTEFHRWVHEHEDRLSLTASTAFADFIEKQFSVYARHYLRIRAAAETLTPGLEYIFYNALSKFTLQYPVLLAPLTLEDSEIETLRKLRVVSRYLDILIARRIWNFRSIDYSTVQYTMFIIMKDIRGRSALAVAELLTAKLAEEKEVFASNDRFHLHGGNGRQVRRILARFTSFLEEQSGLPSHLTEYVQRRGKSGYEVEHIWANHPERHKDEFEHAADFQDYRNRIGGLLLLPKSFNTSYGDLPYDEKRRHYRGQNILAQSLCADTYDHNPGFKRFLQNAGLNFQPHDKFKKAEIEERSRLYQKLAETIWNPALLLRDAQSVIGV